MITRGIRFINSLMLAITCAFAWSADTAQHKSVNGIDVFYGVVPAELVQDHIERHGADRMHGKTSFSRGNHHLVVTLYDAQTSKRIDDAKVTATVTPLGLAPERKILEVMKIDNAVSYGNYFSMSPGDTPYRIELSIERPTAHPTVKTEFKYRHGISR